MYRLLHCLLIPVVVLTLSACEKDYIDVNNVYYLDGGPGTSITTGAVEFNVNVKGIFNDFDYAEIRLYPQGGLRRIDSHGSHTIVFVDLPPGTYTYNIDEWLYDSGVYSSTGYTYSTYGGWSSSSSLYFGSPGYDREYYDGTVVIEADKTAVIEIEF